MKHISKFIIAFSVLAFSLGACEKDEVKNYFEGGTEPVLTASASEIILEFLSADEDAITMSWTNPDYKFTTGVSSQDVSYILEIDTVGANFTNPARQSISISQELSKTFKVSELNDYLLNQLQLTPGVPHNIEFRVTSSLSNAVPLNSNSLAFEVIPYAIPPKVQLPFTGELYLVGDATYGGWNNPVPLPAQQFTKVSETLYEIVVPMYGGKFYLMLPQNGSWDNKYAVKDQTIPGLSEGGDFFLNAAKDIPGPAADGTYKIQADFQRGKFTVTKQ